MNSSPEQLGCALPGMLRPRMPNAGGLSVLEDGGRACGMIGF